MYLDKAFKERIQTGHETIRIHQKQFHFLRPLHLQLPFTPLVCHHPEVSRQRTLPPSYGEESVAQRNLVTYLSSQG